MTEQTQPKTTAQPSLVQVLGDLSRAVERLRFWSLLTVAQTAFGAVALIVVVWLGSVVVGVAERNKDSLDILRNITSEEARTTSRENLDRVIVELLAEIDCVGRRQSAGLPPAPARRCQASTPPHVYPGK